MIVFAGDRSLHESQVQGGGRPRSRLEFRMELGCDEVGVAVQLPDLHLGAVLGPSREVPACFFEPFDVLGVDLVSVSVAFGDVGGAVEGGCLGPLLHEDALGTEPHRPAHLCHSCLLGHDEDHRVAGSGFEFCTVRILESEEVAGNLDGGYLESQAYTEEGDAVLACILRRSYLPFHAPDAETSGDQDAVNVAQDGGGVAVEQVVAVNELHMHFAG